MHGSWSSIYAPVIGNRAAALTGGVVTSSVNHERCRDDLAVGDVVVDLLGGQLLPGLVRRRLADHRVSFQLVDDEVAFGVGIGIGRVGDLKRQLSQREAGILGACADPIDVLVIRGRWF